jgi:N-acylneuraminate cytidylyltransferase|tara:strand:+ start:84 stop:725 length:642 start_codon:yes stop_codon:yes gene_type:complete
LKIVSLTLARGGSKGLPRKNLALLQGRPLIYYAIEASKTSKVDQTWVSTEDKEIASVSLSLGASVIDRPDDLATDTSKCEESLLHFAENVDFDIIVFIQTTSPLVTSEDINKGIDLLQTGDYDSVFSVTEEHWVPKWTKDMTPINWDHFKRPRRQEMETTFIENGAFYITTKNFLLKHKNRYGGNIGYVEIPLSRSFQIDSLEELELIGKLLC